MKHSALWGLIAGIAMAFLAGFLYLNLSLLPGVEQDHQQDIDAIEAAFEQKELQQARVHEVKLSQVESERDFMENSVNRLRHEKNQNEERLNRRIESLTETLVQARAEGSGQPDEETLSKILNYDAMEAELAALKAERNMLLAGYDSMRAEHETQIQSFQQERIERETEMQTLTEDLTNYKLAVSRFTQAVRLEREATQMNKGLFRNKKAIKATYTEALVLYRKAAGFGLEQAALSAKRVEGKIR